MIRGMVWAHTRLLCKILPPRDMPCYCDAKAFGRHRQSLVPHGVWHKGGLSSWPCLPDASTEAEYGGRRMSGHPAFASVVGTSLTGRPEDHGAAVVHNWGGWRGWGRLAGGGLCPSQFPARHPHFSQAVLNDVACSNRKEKK